jgi:hypothetical protein
MVAEWTKQCAELREVATAEFQKACVEVEEANEAAIAESKAAHEAAVAAAEAHNAQWSKTVERKRRALAELERVRAFNDTVVAAAVATRWGYTQVESSCPTA